MSEPWPAGLSDSLWSYHLLTAENRSYLPMIGVEFSPSFLYAFAFGALFTLFFAWNRFRTKASDKQFASYDVLRDIDVAKLGGQSAMLRAYFIYAFALLIAYVALTFFGKLILQTAQSIPFAGVSVDIGALKFDTPQWPLTLAFAFAGLAPMLPPLAIAEDWLRNRAFRAVGIPVRIEQTTRHIISLLENTARDDAPRDKSGAPRPDPLRATLERFKADLNRQLRDSVWWNAQQSERLQRRQDLVCTLAELEILLFWTKTSRGGWPGRGVSQAVREAEARQVETAEDLLTSFQQRLAERPESVKAGDAPTASRTASDQRRDDAVTRTIAEARKHRDNLAALLAVYTERDPIDERNLSSVEASLAALLQRIEPVNRAGSGPEAAVLACIPPLALLYAVAAWKGMHPLLSGIAPRDDLRTILFTAAIETLRVISLVWLPLLAAFSLRQYLWDDRAWAFRIQGSKPLEAQRAQILTQRCIALALGLCVGVIGLGCAALLASFAIAESPARFRELLFSGSIPSVLYYPSQAIISVPIILCSLKAADARLQGGSGRAWGLISAAAVAILVAALYAFWNGDHKSCVNGQAYLTDMFQTGCFQTYIGLDYVVLSLLAFLSAAVFGTYEPPASAPPEPARKARPGSAIAALAAGLLAVVLAFPQEARAQAGDGGATGGKTVVIGFRPDVAPFSYRARGDMAPGPGTAPTGSAQAAGARFAAADAPDAPYKGFLADLCYWIFRSSEYRVVELQVTARDRFDRLRQVGEAQNPGDPQKIDLLCDPVTIRFSNVSRTDKRSEKGIYSPIVFASGVSYFEKVTRRPGDLFIGYVANTTAAPVARRTCLVDLFRVLTPDQKDGLYERCEFAWHRAMAHQIARDIQYEKDKPPPPKAPPEAPLTPSLHSVSLAAQDPVQPPDEEDAPYRELRQHLVEALELSRPVAEAAMKGEPGDFQKDDEKFAAEWRKLREALTTLQSDYAASGYRDWARTGAEKILKATEDAACVPAPEPAVAKKASDPAPDPRAKPPRASVHFCVQESHDELIEWFCGPTSKKRRLVYMGDLDLIRSKLETWQRDRYSCGVERPEGAANLTYEPYALMTTPADPELARFVQRRIYEFFSDRELAVSAFGENFRDQTGNAPRTMSTALAYLFLLNAVEDAALFDPALPQSTLDLPTVAGGR